MKLLSNHLLKLRLNNDETKIGGVIENNKLVGYYKGKAPKINAAAMRVHFKFKKCFLWFLPTNAGDVLVVIGERSINFLEIETTVDRRANRGYILTKLFTDEMKSLVIRCQRVLSNGNGKMDPTVDVSFQRLSPKEIVAAIFILDCFKYEPRIGPTAKPAKDTYWGKLQPAAAELLETGDFGRAAAKRGRPLHEMATALFGFPSQKDIVFQMKEECEFPFYTRVPNCSFESFLCLQSVPPKPSSSSSHWNGFITDLGVKDTLDGIDAQWLAELLRAPEPVISSTPELSQLTLIEATESPGDIIEGEDDGVYEEFKLKRDKGASALATIEEETSDVDEEFKSILLQRVLGIMSQKKLKDCVREIKHHITVTKSNNPGSPESAVEVVSEEGCDYSEHASDDDDESYAEDHQVEHSTLIPDNDRSNIVGSTDAGDKNNTAASMGSTTSGGVPEAHAEVVPHAAPASIVSANKDADKAPAVALPSNGKRKGSPPKVAKKKQKAKRQAQKPTLPVISDDSSDDEEPQYHEASDV